MSSTLAGGEPGAWGPTLRGGHRGRLRRGLILLTAVVAGAGVFLVATGLLLYQRAEANLTRVPVTSLAAGRDQGPLHFLVVGSDARTDLTPEERAELNLGDFTSALSDTVMLVTLTADGQDINVVSFPRDLLVYDQGRRAKLTETFGGDPNNLVEVFQGNFGIHPHHYAQISLGGFINVVETLGSVEICLEEQLRDSKSGADFDAGCHVMSPPEALSYVRSRSGARGDFERIERQQTFMKAMLRELVDARILADLPRLFSVVEDVARNVTTDDGLGLGQMRTLAQELRGLASGDIPMTFVPGYTRTIDGKSYVVAYAPGARALFDSLRRGDKLAPRGSRDERGGVDVAVWSGGRQAGAGIVASTLQWSGFGPFAAGSGAVDAGATTTVFQIPGFEDEAGWVGATLGAPIQKLPADVTPPDGVHVVVAVGDDATT